MNTALAVTRVARSQDGSVSEANCGHWNNIQKYAPAIGFANGLAWCDTFVNWCFAMTAISVPAGVKSAGCAVSVNAYKKAGRFTEYPGIGFQVFFGPGGSEHTGIVYDYNATTVFVVAGNTNHNNSAEGDGVYETPYARKSTHVYGYGIPYFAGTLKSADPKWNGKKGAK